MRGRLSLRQHRGRTRKGYGHGGKQNPFVHECPSSLIPTYIPAMALGI
jgi:hypothetical protein